MKYLFSLLILIALQSIAQSPAEIARKISEKYQKESVLEFREKPIDAVQKGILVMNPQLKSRETIEIETMITIHSIDRRFIALSASPGEIKLWFNDQLIFEGITALNGIPVATSEEQYQSEYSDLLSSFPGDYAIRIQYTPSSENHLIYLWMKDEDGRTELSTDFRSDWDSFDIYPYRFRSSGSDEWSYPQPVMAMLHESPENMNDWKYSTGMALDAIWSSAQHFQYPAYKKFVRDHLDFFVDSFAEISEKQSSNGVLEPPFFRYFRYQQPEDYGPQLMPFLYFSENDNHKKMVSKGLNQIMYKASRLPDGMLVRDISEDADIKAEDLYMGISLLCRAYRAYGSRRYLEEAIKQVILYNNKLREKYTGLYRHGISQGVNAEKKAVKWSRANGLAMMAHVELMRAMPKNHPEREALARIFQKHAESVREQQSPEGLWHQVLDDESTYLETSASAMFIYAFAEGITNGWLYNKEEFKRSAISGWLAVTKRVDEAGNVTGITPESPVLETVNDYNQLEAKTNDPTGMSAVLYAAVAMHKLGKD
ncbi:MAG: glycoside hydrolase family 88 protein [Cyclobacteriaceae bacterium]